MYLWWVQKEHISNRILDLSDQMADQHFNYSSPELISLQPGSLAESEALILIGADEGLGLFEMLSKIRIQNNYNNIKCRYKNVCKIRK